jgi:hypothetical protein
MAASTTTAVTIHNTILWRLRFEGTVQAESGKHSSSGPRRYARKKAAPRNYAAAASEYGL